MTQRLSDLSMTMIRPEIRSTKSEIREIDIESIDLGALLVDFLSEVLYLIQTNKEIYSDAKFLKLTDSKIEAEILGQKVERFKEDIKAVTYYDLQLEKIHGGWQAVILFDI